MIFSGHLKTSVLCFVVKLNIILTSRSCLLCLSMKLFGLCLAALQARQAEMEATRLAREKEEEEAKQVAQQAKKEKEAQKKAIKKERQKLRTTCKVRERQIPAVRLVQGPSTKRPVIIKLST